ncbi:MAG: HAD family hydrolase [Armatimonadota bacterium]
MGSSPTSSTIFFLLSLSPTVPTADPGPSAVGYHSYTKQRIIMHPSIRCVLFDVDGTLIDTTDLIAGGLAHAVKLHVGVEPPRSELVALIGRPLVEQMRVYGRESQVEAMSRSFIDYYERNHHLERPFPGALEMLKAVHDHGYTTGIVTSKNRTEVENFLGRFPIRQYLDIVVSSSDSPRPKPSPDPVLKALEMSGAHPCETLFVGDSVYDMRSGKSAGVLTGAALWGPFGRDILAPESPDFMFECPDDVVRLLC